MDFPFKPSLYFLFLFLPMSLYAQDKEYDTALKLMKLKEYVVVRETDTVYFLTTVPDKKKKTIVFCQGSGPVPLVIKLQQGLCSPFPFDIDSNTRKEFNMVIISKPGLKRFATEADLDAESVKHGQMLQLDSMNRPPLKYTLNNSLHKLGGDGIAVIKFLRKQPWVDKDNIYIYGHSQGAVVAAYVASKDPADIKGLIYSQGNAYGIHAGYLSALLYEPPARDLNKKIDSICRLHTALVSGIPDKEMAELYQWKIADLFDKKNNDFYDLYTSRWRSLEEPVAMEYLLKVKAPVLLVQGLHSPGDMDNKNIPLDFIRHHKHNLTTRFYPGYDHNFFEQATDAGGNSKEPEFHWTDVFNDVKNWIRSPK